MSTGEPVRCAYCGSYYGGHLGSCRYQQMPMGTSTIDSPVKVVFQPIPVDESADELVEALKENERLRIELDALKARRCETCSLRSGVHIKPVDEADRYLWECAKHTFFVPIDFCCNDWEKA